MADVSTRALASILFVTAACSANDAEDRDAATSAVFLTVTARAWAFENPPGDGQCLPAIAVTSSCAAQCTMIISDDTLDASCVAPGLSQPDGATLHWLESTTMSAKTYCVVAQLVGGPDSSVAVATGCSNSDPPAYQGASCAAATNTNAGWCLVEGPEADGCVQDVRIAGAVPATASVTLFCTR